MKDKLCLIFENLSQSCDFIFVFSGIEKFNFPLFINFIGLNIFIKGSLFDINHIIH